MCIEIVVFKGKEPARVLMSQQQLHSLKSPLNLNSVQC